MARVIQVFEYEKLTLREDWRGRKLLPKELEKLYEFNDKNDNNYFTGIRDGVKFKNFVGVIQIGGLTIEILPKADKSNISSQQEKDTWQSVLLHMLRVCKKIQVETVSETQLKKRYH